MRVESGERRYNKVNYAGRANGGRLRQPDPAVSKIEVDP